MAAGQVSTTLSEWLLVFLIVVSLLFEAALHRLEHWIGHRHQHLQGVVKVLYRELMILGVVSFSFILYETFAKPTGDTILSFEFAHVFIFLLAIFYTFVVLTSMYTSLRLSHRWKRMEQIDLVKYLHMKEQYGHLRSRVRKHHGSFWRFFWWWFPNFRELFRYRKLHETMAFHDIRFQFIFYRNLPESFRFSSFLRKIKSITFIELVESHWSLYVIFLAIVLADIVRRLVQGTEKDIKKIGADVVESSFIIAAAILLMVLVQVLAMKIKRIYWELTKNPRIYYEGVEPQDVEAELAAAEKRLEQERAERRQSRSRDGAPEDSGNLADDEATDAARVSDSPESEMLDPMHLHVGKSKGGKDAMGANAAAWNGGSSIDVSSDATSINFREQGPTTRVSLDDAPGRTSGPSGREYSGLSGDAYDDSSLRSLDRHVRREVIVNRSTGPSGEYQRPSLPESAEYKIAIEYQETASRHSLELLRAPIASVPNRPPPGSKATAAKAALEAAARKKNMTVVDEVEHRQRHSLDAGRHSLDAPAAGESQRHAQDPKRRVGSPRILSLLSSRGASLDNDRPVSGSDFGRTSVEGRGRGGERRSIELARVISREELAKRFGTGDATGAAHDIEAGIVDEDSGTDVRTHVRQVGFSPGTGRTTSDGQGDTTGNGHKSRASLNRHQSLGLANATIVKNLEQHEQARNTIPDYYPGIIKKLFPRLARVASPVEKLFWFGSHRFYMWCVEFCLFFSTVLLSAATASISLLALQKDKKTGEGRPITALNITSLVLSALTLLFVLFRIAGIITKYIFILHNASLVREALAIETIQGVSKKTLPGQADDLSDLSGDETEREEGQAAVERRKVLGRFFRSEAASGNIPGIAGGDGVMGRMSLDGPRRRLTLRKRASQRRKDRISQSKDGMIPAVPGRQPSDSVFSD